MKQLTFNQTLSQATVQSLAALQDKLDKKQGYEAQCNATESAWSSKEASQNNRAAFQEIRQWLLLATTGTQQCNYCEQNEATDIEHIFPKSIFPGRTFRASNYLMACPICNSRYKKDNFEVYHPTTHQRVNANTRNGHTRVFNPPASERSVMLDPTWEDTLAYFHLDIKGQTFQLIARETDPQHANAIRAQYTHDLLGLNRPALSDSRRKAAIFYLNELNRYVKARQANTITELSDALTDLDAPLNAEAHFPAEQQRVMHRIKQNIQTAAHPSVWKELLRQSADLPRTKQLLTDAPEARNW